MSATADISRLLLPDQAAATLGISARQLRAIVDAGDLMYVDVGRGKVNACRRFDPADLARYIESKRKIRTAQCPSKKEPRRRSGITDSNVAAGDFSARRKQQAAGMPRR